MKRLLHFLLFLFFAQVAAAQVLVESTGSGEPVEILAGTQRQRFQRLDDGTELQILAGTVGLRQGRTRFYCDSLVLNSITRVFEAFGNVHIDDDTTQIYSDYLRYHTDRRIAFLTNNVRLTDGRSRVTTNELEYDVATKTATYRNNGRVAVGKSVVTSREGTYYRDLNEIFFKHNVELKDPSTYLKTDSMIYNTETRQTRLITDTYIRDSAGRVIRTSEAVYDMNTRMATFTQRTTIDDKCLRVVGDRIANDEATGILQVEGNAVLIDTCQGVNILANQIFANKRTESYLATKQPLMIIKQDKDSIFVAADTLFSGRLSELARYQPLRNIPDSVNRPSGTDSTAGSDSLAGVAGGTDSLARKNGTTDSTTLAAARPNRDSVTAGARASVRTRTPARTTTASRTEAKATVKAPAKKPVKDSTDRYFEAFRNVRIFSDSLQAVGDSLFYSFRDSVFRLFKDPVVWNKKNQVTGDTIYLFTKNKKADRIRVFNNSFLASEVQRGVYNQVKSSRLDGYFREGTIDSVRCRGFAESMYFMQDDDSAFTGINETTADILDVRFLKGDLHRVIYRSSVKGTVWPIRQRQPSEMRLKGFGWHDARRPKSRYELFQ
ncbi:OstA-like protein [Flaviaesturariibacter amylovorans]|uniref:Organic solvent tolerance-like N-terminal domain-containing protein n=1 Tax=Flaviaesturariibacter amylovorans TaxID=1084520 RepID=A0ABP8GVM0_9BACT